MSWVFFPLEDTWLFHLSTNLLTNFHMRVHWFTLQSRLENHKQNIKSNNMSQWPSKWRQEALHDFAQTKLARFPTLWRRNEAWDHMDCTLQDNWMLGHWYSGCQQNSPQWLLWVEVLQRIPGPLTCHVTQKTYIYILYYLYTCTFFWLYTFIMYLLTNPRHLWQPKKKTPTKPLDWVLI